MPEWKIIKNYKNYSVSDDGNIKNNITQRILKTYIRNGYKSVTLSLNNMKKTHNIHSVVAEHFLEKPSDGKYVVNHKDENKLNNILDNLEYVTYKENTLYSANPKRRINIKNFSLEHFQDIPGFNNYMISKDGDIYSKILKRLCCITKIPSGYYKLKLKNTEGAFKDQYVHVLVAITYLSHKPEKGIVVNHKDGKKDNNNVSNLEIVSAKENMIHSVTINKDRLYRRGVYYINKENIKVEYSSAKEASDKTGIDNSSILKSCKSLNKKAGNIKWHYMSNS